MHAYFKACMFNCTVFDRDFSPALQCSPTGGLRLVCLPDVVAFAVRLFVTDEASASLVKRLVTVATSQAPDMPLEVRRHSQNVLVKDLFMTSCTDGTLTVTTFHWS